MDEPGLRLRNEAFQLRVFIENILLEFNLIQSLDHFVNHSSNFYHVLLLVLELLNGLHKLGEILRHVGLVLNASPVPIA
jgi:hypothetical protein